MCRLYSCIEKRSLDLYVIVVVHIHIIRMALYRTATAILTLVLFQVSAIHVVYPVNDEG